MALFAIVVTFEELLSYEMCTVAARSIHSRLDVNNPVVVLILSYLHRLSQYFWQISYVLLNQVDIYTLIPISIVSYQ